jgi:hypothetical protein
LLAETGVSLDPLNVRVQCSNELVGIGLEAVNIVEKEKI